MVDEMPLRKALSTLTHPNTICRRVAVFGDSRRIRRL